MDDGWSRMRQDDAGFRMKKWMHSVKSDRDGVRMMLRMFQA